LQYLTIAELNVMSKMSRKIMETILKYRLKEIRARQGQLYTFGDGAFGKLGDGNTNYHNVGTPTLINVNNKNIAQVSCGTSYTGVTTEDRHLYTFGNGRYGVLGDGIFNSHLVGIPTRINVDNKKAVQVSCGTEHTAVITQQPPNPGWPTIASQCISCYSSIDGHCSTCLTPICYSCFDYHIESKHL